MRSVGDFAALYCVAFAAALSCSAGMTGRIVPLFCQKLPGVVRVVTTVLISSAFVWPRSCPGQASVGRALAKLLRAK